MNWAIFNQHMNPGILRTRILRICLTILFAASFWSMSLAKTSDREQQWSDEITTFLRDSICSRDLISEWPDREWLEHPLFTDNDTKTFFSSDTITVYVEYDYMFSWVSIALYNGMYEKWITIEPMEKDHRQVVGSVHYDYDLKRPDFSDIFQAEPFELTYFYIINWDFNIPEFILDHSGFPIQDDHTRFLAFRIIRCPDNTFSVQNCPIDLSSLLSRK